MSSGMYPAVVSESDSAAAERVAAALGRLRGPRSGGPGEARGRHHGHPRFGGPGHESPPAGPLGDPGLQGGPALRGPGGHEDPGPRGPGPHGGPRPRGAWRDGGPLGRMAAQFRLLDVLLAASMPPSVSELAAAMGVDQPRASRLVQAAVEAGHVRREADAADARRTQVVLTDEGRALVVRARGERIAAVEHALAGFTPAEREQLATLLAKLAEAWPR